MEQLNICAARTARKLCLGRLWHYKKSEGCLYERFLAVKIKFGTQGSNQRKVLSFKITLVKYYGRWTILMKFIEFQM